MSTNAFSLSPLTSLPLSLDPDLLFNYFLPLAAAQKMADLEVAAAMAAGARMMPVPPQQQQQQQQQRRHPQQQQQRRVLHARRPQRPAADPNALAIDGDEEEIVDDDDLMAYCEDEEGDVDDLVVAAAAAAAANAALARIAKAPPVEVALAADRAKQGKHEDSSDSCDSSDSDSSSSSSDDDADEDRDVYMAPAERVAVELAVGEGELFSEVGALVAARALSPFLENRPCAGTSTTFSSLFFYTFDRIGCVVLRDAFCLRHQSAKANKGGQRSRKTHEKGLNQVFGLFL